MTDFTRQLRKPKEGDIVSASQQGLLVDNARRTEQGFNAYRGQAQALQRILFEDATYASFRPDSGFNVEVGDLVELYEVENDKHWPITYKAKKFDGSDMTPEKLVAINYRKNVKALQLGRCVLFGLVEQANVQASSGGAIPDIGAPCGPVHNQVFMDEEHVGYIYLGESDEDTADDLHVVKRVMQNTTGQGSVYAGETGTPALIRLDEVTFDGGLNSWDETSAFYVVNVFSDPVEADLHCQFKWDPQADATGATRFGDGAFVVTDIECIT